jgi:beta-lactamase regulating signal transducer with metallopeptidase domain
VKFLLPFALLVAIGSHFQWPPASGTGQAAPLSAAVEAVGEPFAANGTPALSTLSEQKRGLSLVLDVVMALWMTGFAVNLIWWFTRWRQLRRVMSRATTLKINIALPVLSCSERLEPGVFGIFRPVLLLPEGITDRLSPAQFQTVISHELCHARRRDNLTAAIHLLVEALFWFHPLVWWIKLRLIEEQERACDEEVLRLGAEPKVYAESILRLCEFYLTSPLACAAGMTSSNLKKRIEEIMSNRVALRLSLSRSLTIAIAALTALAGPLIVGAARPKVQPIKAEALTPVGPLPQQVTIREQQNAAPPRDTAVRGLGTVVASSRVAVKPQIDGQLLSVNFKEGDAVQAGQLLATIDAPQSPYSEIRSPIAGVAGLRQTDPGNIVRVSDTTPIVVITQTHPIVVLFTIPEDLLPPVLALLRKGANVTVEAWDHDYAVKLATGSLIAADNQIDTITGTIKLKALFDNKDDVLFPNQFVNVQMLLN